MEDKEEELLRLKLAIMSAPPPPPPPSLPQTPPPPSSVLCFLSHPHPSPSLQLPEFFHFPPPTIPEPPVFLPNPSSYYARSGPAHLVPAAAAAAAAAPRPRRAAGPTCRRSRSRKSPSRIVLLLKGKTLGIPPPYPWATAERAKVRSVGDLVSAGVMRVKGEVKCRRCESRYEMEHDLVEKFREVERFLEAKEETMHNRAPAAWMSPTLPNCRVCKESKCVKPVVEKKRCINWLFLFLGQMIGCCKLTHLKYFCKHNDHHSTGAKDRVVYFTYKTLYRQLKQPT